jgi:glutamyl-Q tRNA(Asp) synthetase
MTDPIPALKIATLLPQLDRYEDFADQVVTRFAPSPNGYLHIGHALSAICAHDFARAHAGQFMLRVEDIDGTRSRPEYSAAILADLKWLGLGWDSEPVYQSARIGRYRAALDSLSAMGLIYACVCSRADIGTTIRNRPVAHGPDGPVYPGTCRRLNLGGSEKSCYRLNMRAALRYIETPLVWTDLAAGAQAADPAIFGDIVLWRKDAPASYHLAATVDDAADGVTHIVRGRDLFAYTAVHILLQKLLGLLQPAYWHHPLLADVNGEKLGKSKGSAALAQRRSAGEEGLALAHSIRGGKLPLGISVMND